MVAVPGTRYEGNAEIDERTKIVKQLLKNINGTWYTDPWV